jgi:hypothetical protein
LSWVFLLSEHLPGGLGGAAGFVKPSEELLGDYRALTHTLQLFLPFVSGTGKNWDVWARAYSCGHPVFVFVFLL